MTYEVVSTGRLFATNATLQGYNKEVRYAALQGCFAYDMESAHQSILLQLLEEEGADFTELDVLREYVNEKKAVDRKSTRLNSSHVVISYAVFCLKKKKKNKT